MAKVSISKIKTDFKISDIMDIKFKVDVDFMTIDCYKSMLESGFNPQEWEIKNNQKILVEGKHYTEY